MDEDHEQENDPAEIPVLREIVEIRTDAEGKRVTIPLDLEQLATRITDTLANQLHKELSVQLEVCLDEAVDATMTKIRSEVQQMLLAQLGNQDG